MTIEKIKKIITNQYYFFKMSFELNNNYVI